MKTLSYLLLSLAALLTFLQGCASNDAPSVGKDQMKQSTIFATLAAESSQVTAAVRLAESLRAFGGSFAQTPLWIVAPDDLAITDDQQSAFTRLGITLLRGGAPQAIRWLFYADKPYAAAVAEKATEGQATVLVWLDFDSVILKEPSEMNLADSICLAWRPVMHNRSGSLYDEPPGPFWARIYEKLGLTDDLLFPIITPADQQKIRAYFHCGLIAVRPERGILRRWATDFETLAADSTLAAMCHEDGNKRIFLHQTALTGSILHLLSPAEMVAFSDSYNYPIFFKQAYGGVRDYDDLTGVATIRVLVDPARISPDWPQLLKGPADRIAWLQDHL